MSDFILLLDLPFLMFRIEDVDFNCSDFFNLSSLPLSSHIMNLRVEVLSFLSQNVINLTLLLSLPFLTLDIQNVDFYFFDVFTFASLPVSSKSIELTIEFLFFLSQKVVNIILFLNFPLLMLDIQDVNFNFPDLFNFFSLPFTSKAVKFYIELLCLLSQQMIHLILFLNLPFLSFNVEDIYFNTLDFFSFCSFPFCS